MNSPFFRILFVLHCWQHWPGYIVISFWSFQCWFPDFGLIDFRKWDLYSFSIRIIRLFKVGIVPLITVIELDNFYFHHLDALLFMITFQKSLCRMRLLTSIKTVWQPQTAFFRFRYWKPEHDPKKIFRYGYNDDHFYTGLLPRGNFDRLKSMKIYRPKNAWNQTKRTFGQNDYIDILGLHCRFLIHVFYVSFDRYIMFVFYRRWKVTSAQISP